MEVESEFVICPFNSSHKILRYRMPYHIVKCKKNYQGEPLHQCPFNATHYIKKCDMQKHFDNCREYQLAFKEKHENFFEDINTLY